MSIRGEERIEASLLRSTHHHLAEHGGGTRAVATPKARAPSEPSHKLIVQFVDYLSRYDAEPERLAAYMLAQPVEVQRHLYRFVAALLAAWSEMGECTGQSHPLANEYETAGKMVNNLFR